MKLTSNDDDGLLTQLIAAASDGIGRFCARSNLGKIYTYTENYFKRWTTTIANGEFDLILRHYPVTTLSQVLMNGNNAVQILNNTSIINGSAGVYLMVEDEEPRTLKFRRLFRDNTVPIQVTYQAGYPSTGIPPGLAQAANAFAAEIYRSQGWLGYKSKVLAGENINYDMGESWGMSKRVQAMLKNYINVVPWMGG